MEVKRQVPRLLRGYKKKKKGTGKNIICNLSPYERESKTVLDTGFHAADSGFQVLDSLNASLCQWNLYSGV